jgi:hypothetical protein
MQAGAQSLLLHTLFLKERAVEHLGFDNRLPLESQLRLRQVELQAENLNAAQLRECLLAAWSGWLLERHLVNRAIETVGVQVDMRVRGYTPAEVCQLES